MDWQLVQPIFSWLSENPAWSGFFVFLVAFSESLLIVGIIVPGTVLMFGIGTLVGTGVLDIRETMLMAFLGAVTGDSLSYWIGVKYHRQLSSVWPLKNNPEYLNHGKRYFLKHGGKSVFFGRFIGPVRPFIPAVAGMMKMPAKYFFLINIISAAAWAPFYLLPGIVFGTSIGLASIVGSRLMIILVVLVVSAFLLVWLIRKTMLYVTPRMESFYLKGYRIAAVNSVFGSAVKAIIDPDTAERRGLYFFSTLIFLSLLVVTLFLGQFSFSILSTINESVAHVALLVRSDFTDRILLSLWEVYSWFAITLSVVSYILFLFFYRQTLAIKHFALLLFLAVGSSVVLNMLTHSTQVTSVFVNLKIVIFSSFLLFFSQFITQQIVDQPRNFAKRWMVYSLFGIAILMLVLTELYFGKSKIVDVISSLSIAYIWVLLMTTALRRHTLSLAKVKLKAMVVCVSIVFFVTGSFSVNRNYDQDFSEIALQNKAIILADQRWVDDISTQLHSRRKDIFGIKKQALNIQWAGSLSNIEASLNKLGWQLAVVADYRTILFWLNPDVSLRELSRIPQTHLGKKESLIMLKYSGEKESVKVLQLWSTEYTIDDNNVPLWLGSITRQAKVKKTKWLAKISVNSLTSNEINIFENDVLAQSYVIRRHNNPDVLLISTEEIK